MSHPSLVEWCEQSGFEEYADGLEKLEFDSVNQLAVLSDKDLEEVCKELNLRFGRKGKFIEAVRKVGDKSHSTKTPKKKEQSEEKYEEEGRGSEDDQESQHSKKRLSPQRSNKEKDVKVSQKLLKPCGNSHKSNCILLLGECGSGKSTFLNYLCNFFENKSPPHVVQFTETSASIVDEKKQMDAHTQDCKTWGPFHYANTNYHIIDTPGLADTAGLEKDAQNLDKILECVSQCDTLIGIILVVNGAASRFTANLALVFSKLASNLPDEVLNNACVVFTNCQMASDRNFQIEMIDFLKKPFFTYVQNSYKFGHEYDLESEEFDAQDDRWKISMKKIGQLMTFFDGKQPKITRAFKELRTVRQQLKYELSHCYQDIESLSKHEEVLRDLKQQIEAAQQTKNLNAKFQIKKMVTKTRFVETSYHNTVCRACNNLCHERCGLEYTPGGGDVFKGCACMSGDACSIPECRHSFSSHFHDKKVPKT